MRYVTVMNGDLMDKKIKECLSHTWLKIAYQLSNDTRRSWKKQDPGVGRQSNLESSGITDMI